MNLIDAVLQRVLEDEGLRCARMISGDKTCPEGHICFFNACIFVRLRVSQLYALRRKHEFKQVWWGDLDLDVDGPAIQRVANFRRETLYVTREKFRWNGLTDRDVKKPVEHGTEMLRVYKPEQ